MNQEPSRSTAPKQPDPATIHYLHIGKTGGTAIKRLVAQAEHPAFQAHGHGTKLADLPLDAPYFFSIRQPLTRFYSGFYSRKRRGQPTYNRPWSPGEEAAFLAFPHATDLAEALSDRGPIGQQAVRAIRAIQHTGSRQVWSFAGHEHLFVSRPPVGIIRQEHFEGDLARFAARVGLRLRARPESGRIHANDYTGLPPLSARAKANLALWYADDIAFYGLCEQWLAANS